MKSITNLFLLIAWIAGIVIANGFWPTLFAFIPFYAWYLVVEKGLQQLGWI